MNSVGIKEIAEQSELLFEKARSIIRNAENVEVRSIHNNIPKHFVDGDDVKIVFCGQYSAGKSTILSLLTGIDLEVSGGICTSGVTELDWNGIKVYDTPGIHTQIHPDHDQITYDAISKADLLIFVLTNEGFSSHLGEHFRKLINDKKKGREMMLVVNKMENGAAGNTLEAREILLEKDIKPVIAPFSGEDLYITFIDADSYKKSMKGGKTQDYYKKKSNFDELEVNINKFASDKGLYGKYANNLHRLEHIIEDALSKYRSGDELIDGSIVVLDQKIRKYNESISKIENDLETLKYKYRSSFVAQGNLVADAITEKSKEKDINDKLATAQKTIDSLCNKMQEETAAIISNDLANLENELGKLKDSQFVKNLQNAVTKCLKNRFNIDSAVLDKASGVVNKVGQIGESLSKMCLKSGAENFAKLANVAGSDIHKTVLAVGHFFGKSFKPWEAVKWAKNIGQVGKFVGVVGGLLGPVLQGWSDAQEDKQAKQLSDARLSVRNAFVEEADVIDMTFDQNTQTWIQENLRSEIDKCNKEKKALRDKIDNKKDDQKKLEGILSEVRDLIDRIQNMR